MHTTVSAPRPPAFFVEGVTTGAGAGAGCAATGVAARGVGAGAGGGVGDRCVGAGGVVGAGGAVFTAAAAVTLAVVAGAIVAGAGGGGSGVVPATGGGVSNVDDAGPDTIASKAVRAAESGPLPGTGIAVGFGGAVDDSTAITMPAMRSAIEQESAVTTHIGGRRRKRCAATVRLSTPGVRG